jgi:hypothetical protein
VLRVNAREGQGRLIQTASHEPPDINMNNSSETSKQAVTLIKELILYQYLF